jgi:hypothetical protein
MGYLRLHKYQIFGLLYDTYLVSCKHIQKTRVPKIPTRYLPCTAGNLGGIESSLLKRQPENNNLFITVSLTYSKKFFETNLL